MSRPSSVSLCAGAGGEALGLRWAGFHHAALVEIEPDPCETLRLNGFGNVRQIDVASYREQHAPTLTWASFPCQPWSTQGKREHCEDRRNLWPAIVDQLDSDPPKAFVGENVIGLAQHVKACTPLLPGTNCPGCYLEQVILRDLQARFAFVDCYRLNASGFGVPQHRRRLFIVASDRPIGRPVPTHGPGKPMPWVTIKDALGLEIRLDGGRNSKANPRQERPITSSEPCFTIGTRGNQIVRFSDGTKRRLEPEECAILMGYPATYRFAGRYKISRYRQIGNSVCPAVADAIGRQVMAAHGIRPPRGNHG